MVTANNGWVPLSKEDFSMMTEPVESEKKAASTGKVSSFWVAPNLTAYEWVGTIDGFYLETQQPKIMELKYVT